VDKDSVITIDFSELSGIKEMPSYYQEYDGLKNKEPKLRELRFFNPQFNNKGDLAVIDIRSQDNKDRWIVQIDLENGKIIELNRQHDKAWIGGPGIGGFRGLLGFLPDDKTIYYQSEESGYAHIYLLDVSTKIPRALTQGSWEVREAQLSNDGTTFYITSTTTHPGNREFYKVDVQNGKIIPILTKAGAHEVVLSPDESKMLVRYSYKNQPWELFVGPNTQGSNLTKITSSTHSEFAKYPWRDPEIVSFTAKDGQKVNARIYQPNKKIKNKAAVIFVHGAGYLQNAHNFWSSYHREYMFHNLLADKGYTVLDIDYRGSDGYGRDVRTGIYRHMGGLDLSDHVDGRKFLIDKYGIDPNKIGIYGGSYGGFITLMALLTEPGKFKAGAALRSVTDWAHYNHGYTSNILNFPETDTLAYTKSSPIYFAENLQDKLVMLHGMV
ncbi:MAG TPA: alpha/beta fold hydrolase, partial [Saprospiraceae bacterium]|nr:alpha/beta fold hydrolase [Saprospiraceae bacterium]